MESKRLELVAFSLLFVVLSVMTFFVFEPFLRILVIGAVLSVLLHPLYKKLTTSLHGGQSLIACVLVFFSLIFLIIPLLFLGLKIFGQAQNFFSLTQVGQGQYINSAQQSIDLAIRHIVPNFSFSLIDSINKIMSTVSNNLGSLLSQTAYIFFETFFLLFTLFFFLRDGEKMLGSFIALSPFGKEQNKEILDSVYQTITSVIRGTIFVGLIRFALIALAFYILGIPNALVWATIGGIIGAVPGLGTPFVIIPAFLYFIMIHNIESAVLMGIFGITLSFFVDNMLSVYFFGKGLDVPSIFILFSILGGIIFFGPLGFIFGPIILSLFISAVNMYRILVLKKN